MLDFCRAALELIERDGKCDRNQVRAALPAVRKLVRDKWQDVIDICIVCRKRVRPGAGTRTSKGWRMHRACSRRKAE